MSDENLRLESYFFLLVHMEMLREEKKELEGCRGL